MTHPSKLNCRISSLSCDLTILVLGYFRSSVEAVAKEDQDCQSTNSLVTPLDVTILTNDISFLCDIKEDCHKRGLNRFWDRVAPLFRRNAIRSIEFIVAQTGCVAVARKIEVTGESDDDKNDADALQKEKSSPNTNEQVIAAVQCIRAINTQLTKRAEADYKKSRGSEDPPSPVVINFSLITNDRMGYHPVVQKWFRDLLALDQGKGRITLDLPETIDGMQCALSFEATYKVFPFRADSAAAAGLMTDLQLLARSGFEVLQLVPLSCVDASLISGVPIAVCARLENDLAKYNEMKALVSCLLKYLSDKEVALFLRSTDIIDAASRPIGDPLYHMNGQTFLLMAEELPGGDLMTRSQSQQESTGISQANVRVRVVGHPRGCLPATPPLSSSWTLEATRSLRWTETSSPCKSSPNMWKTLLISWKAPLSTRCWLPNQRRTKGSRRRNLPPKAIQ